MPTRVLLSKDKVSDVGYTHVGLSKEKAYITHPSRLSSSPTASVFEH